MTGALMNVMVNAFIIAMLYHSIGGMITLIIGVFLLIETIGFFLYAVWKKKELTKDR
jgi:hypothetical protein